MHLQDRLKNYTYQQSQLNPKSEWGEAFFILLLDDNWIDQNEFEL